MLNRIFQCVYMLTWNIYGRKNNYLSQIEKMIRVIVILFTLLTARATLAQEPVAKTTTVGFEVDALPYITGGYYASFWVGHKHMRYRAIITQVTAPDFVVPDGFTNNEIQAYTVIVDYFFKEGFEKWWVGSGFEYWDGKIQTDDKLATATYSNTIFTVGGGYVWKFYKNFYLNPWVAVHFRIDGDKEVAVDGEVFTPALLTPEASLKIGWHF